MKPRRSFPDFRLILLLLCLPLLFSSAPAEEFRPRSETDADRKALACFCLCAFHPEYEEEEIGLIRWEQEITVWAGGSPTREDLQTLDAFLAELQVRVPALPPIRRIRQDTAAIRIWYVPQYMMRHYLDGYVEGNWGFFRMQYPDSRIVSARIGIASDCTEQEERNHLLLEELTGALGLPGDHLLYRDSILYDPWTLVQSLSEVDWRMLNMLYSPSLSPGMPEGQARAILKAELGL